MNLYIKHIDVLDLVADALIYSTNVRLNCTGGVGACLMERYGRQVQEDLHGLLRDRGIKFAVQGSIFQHVTTGMPYRQVYHTIPCDGLYNTTEKMVASVLIQSLEACRQAFSVKTIALPALATGYGHLHYDDFFRIASNVLSGDRFDTFDSVTICIADEDSYRMAAEQIKAESLPLTKS